MDLFSLLRYHYVMNTYTNKFKTQLHDKVKLFFEREGFVFGELQYAKWQAKSKNCTASLYNSGKFVMQGNGIDEIVSKFETFAGLSPQTSQQTLFTQTTPDDDDEKIIMPVETYIGTDESGKGDFFGPLITAGVIANDTTRKIFEDAGIKDSKKLDDAKITKLAALIKNSAPFSIIVVTPEKYNSLYESFKNLNKLLAWTHARAIENLLEKNPDCKYALSDKFGDEKFIKNALMTKGSTVNLVQRVRAESDLTVAAASVVARAEFVKRCSEMSRKYGLTFPKGASDKVVQTGKDFVKEFGKDELKKVAKLHFKTTSTVLS